MVIDWGHALMMNHVETDSFLGSFQYFGPSGWGLHQRLSGERGQNIDRHIDWVKGRDNDINAIRSMGMVPQGYAVNHYLSAAKKWFIKTDVPNGMKHFERAPITTKMEGDFETGNVRYKSRERYCYGWSDWRGVYGSNPS